MAERLLDEVNRRAPVEAMASVRVPKPMGRDRIRQSGPARSGLHGLMIEHDLFGRVVLVWRWGRIGEHTRDVPRNRIRRVR